VQPGPRQLDGRDEPVRPGPHHCHVSHTPSLPKNHRITAPNRIGFPATCRSDTVVTELDTPTSTMDFSEVNVSIPAPPGSSATITEQHPIVVDEPDRRQLGERQDAPGPPRTGNANAAVTNGASGNPACKSRPARAARSPRPPVMVTASAARPTSPP